LNQLALLGHVSLLCSRIIQCLSQAGAVAIGKGHILQCVYVAPIILVHPQVVFHIDSKIHSVIHLSAMY
jgi:hypothetical protein